jgi:hypothetical protein
MRQRRLAAVVLLDSLDAYSLNSECVANTLRGLLKCVGQFNSPGKVLDARFCLPTELYHGFMDISSNPLKDFEHRVTLQWHAKELLSIAVHRLVLFLRARYPDAFERVRHLNPDQYADALALFYSVFPKTLRNALGVEEQTLPYILRHTQLLPSTRSTAVRSRTRCMASPLSTRPGYAPVFPRRRTSCAAKSSPPTA